MFRKRPSTPAKKAERLIKHHLSTSARKKLFEDIICTLILTFTLAVIIPAIIFIFPGRPKENAYLIYGYYSLLIFFFSSSLLSFLSSSCLT